MKHISKLLAVLLSLVMIFGLVACSKTSSKSLTIKVETGDTIKVKLDTSEGLSMKWDKEDSILSVKDDDDVVLKMIFADEDHVEEYVEAAEGEVNIKDTGKNGKVKYSMFVTKDEDNEVHYIVGWIIGADTGVIIEGTDSKTKTMDAFESMSFSIEETDQDDEDYYLSCVIMEEEDESEDKDDSNDDNKDPVVNEDEDDEDDENNSENQDQNQNNNNDDKTQSTDSDKLSKNWQDYEFSINGQTFKLPISYKELKEATGYSMKSAEEKSYLEPGYYTGVQLRDADGNGICYVDVLNNTEEDATYADCIIFEVGQTEFQQEDTFSIKFAGGLGVGDVTSKADLIAMFGEPTEVYEYRSDEADMQEYNSDTYTWSVDKDWTTRNNIEIEMNINTGIIEEIYINFSDFE